MTPLKHVWFFSHIAGAVIDIFVPFQARDIARIANAVPFYFLMKDDNECWDHKSLGLLFEVNTRDGHADADRMPIQNMRCIYRAISNICQIMRISALMRICKYIRTAIPNQNTLLIRHSWWPSRGMIIIVTAKYLHMYMDGSPHFWKLITKFFFRNYPMVSVESTNQSNNRQRMEPFWGSEFEVIVLKYKTVICMKHVCVY